MYDSAKLVFDIGSNIGATAILLSKIYPNAIIHCFEPEPENFELLELNTRPIQDRVVLNKVALSNHTKNEILYNSINKNNLGGFSTRISPKDVPSIEIPAISTNFYTRKIGVPDIIKIDCEGAEYDVLLDLPGISKVLCIVGERSEERRV